MDTTVARHSLFLEPYDPKRLANLCGYCGEHIKQLETRLNVEINSRGNFFEIFSSVPGGYQIAFDAGQILQELYIDTLSEKNLTPHCVHLKILETQDSAKLASLANSPPIEFIQTSAEETATGQSTIVDANQSSVDQQLLADDQPKQPTRLLKQIGSQMEKSKLHPKRYEASKTVAEDLTQGDAHRQSLGESNENEIRTLRKVIRLRSANQKLYAQNIAQYDVNFGLGPAGTGKTYLAVAAAVRAFQNDEVKRILLVRPAVEAGEKLGFLPGDLSEKVNPYLRPLYDALHELLGFEQVAKLIDRQIIEVCPLAYMRGRTLSDSFIILDESQNTTPAQMKMLLTRIGFGSKAIITGDVTQIDLPRGHDSGLSDAIKALGHVEGIGFTRFTSQDVVRHPLVKEIIDAYDTTQPMTQQTHHHS